MEPFENALLAARHAPAPTASGLAYVTRRGGRRKAFANAAVAGCALSLAAGAVVATAAVRGGGGGVVTPVTTPSPDATYVVGDPMGWDTVTVGMGRTIVVAWGGGTPERDDPCFYDARARVEETAASVTVTLEPVSEVRAGKLPVCTLRRYARYTTVELAAPLGDRTVVDGSNGMRHEVIRGTG
jgi:hypothetical protein